MDCNQTILALETSLNNCSVALYHKKKFLYLLKKNSIKHEEIILKMIDKILKNEKIYFEKINLIVCTIGPGKFTGIRISTNIVNAISLAKNIPIFGFSTFEILSEKVWNKYYLRKVLISLQFSKKYVFFAKYYKNSNDMWIGKKTEKMFENFFFIKKYKIFLTKGLWATIGKINKNICNQKKNVHFFNTHILNLNAKDILKYTLTILKNKKKILYNNILRPNYLYHIE